MTDVLDQLDDAIHPRELTTPTRRRIQRATNLKEQNMQDPIIEARGALADADAALAALEQERGHLDVQIAAARKTFETEQRVVAETHQAAAARGLDFAGQLLAQQQTAKLADQGAALEQSAFAQRSASDAKLKEARDEVTKCEAAIAMEIMRHREGKFLDLAAKTALAYRDARRAAWSVRQKLGRTKTPQAITDAVFLKRFGTLPFFTPEGASSDAHATWAAVREDVTSTNGINDELRG